MERWRAIAVVAAALCGCGNKEDDVAEVKTALPMEKVPPAPLKAYAPGLTLFAASVGTHEGKPRIELKGKTKSGQIKEIEVSPDGKSVGTD